MKKTLLVSIVMLALTVAHKPTFAQTWQWAKSAGGINWEFGDGVTTDASGNIYVTGDFRSSSVTFGSTTLTNMGPDSSADFYLVKYDASGNVLWAKSAGGTGWDVGSIVTTDAAGNVYVTGTFYSYSITFGTITLTKKGYATPFLVKYDASGNVLWAKSANGSASGRSISTDASGNIYVTGTFSSSSITFGTTTLTSAGSGDLFLAKYDSSGNVLWAKSDGGAGWESGISLSIDASGNVFVTGSFSSDSITFGATTLTNAGKSDFFLAKYDASGNVLWAKSAGTASFDEGTSVTTDASGNAYVTGFFQHSSITFETTTLAIINSADIFLVKYDASGNVLWAKSAGGNYGENGISVSTDASGNVYVAGNFSSDSITFGTTTLTNAKAGYSDIFLAKYDASGNVLWAKSAGGTDFDRLGCIFTDATGNVYIVGSFSTSITFGTNTLTSTGGYDIFLAKLYDNSTGIETEPGIGSFVIYPNPFSTQTVLQSDHLFHNATLTVVNGLGQIVKQIKNISGQTVVLSRDNLANGLYFVHLVQDNQIIATKKIIITD